ncbi:MAG: hypothetical protein JWQ43_3022 [Glaciihabitans sp.]|nr:hypothetical protein [Glaciihabitans sp.]
MSAIVPTVKLHLNKREMTFIVPLTITVVVAIVSVLISLIFWRFGSEPGTPGWIEGSRNNPGIAWSLPGFLIYLGVQSVATTFPFALALGATRRSFVAGTLLWWGGVSAYLTAVLALLMSIEMASGHWFSGFHVLDVYVLGAGNLGILIPVVFLGTLTFLGIGGLFGAAFVRFGARGPQALAVLIGVVVLLGIVLFIPAAEEMAAAFRLWWLAVVALVIVAVALIGTWLLLRPATVR